MEGKRRTCPGGSPVNQLVTGTISTDNWSLSVVTARHTECLSAPHDLHISADMVLSPRYFADDDEGFVPPSIYDPPSPDDHMRSLPEGEEAWLPFLPTASRSALIEPDAWRAAQATWAADLARAAMAVGRLDMLVGVMGGGAITRLALIETEQLLWAAGTPVPADELTRDLIDARAGTDLTGLQQARWAVRRLQGQGHTQDLRGFLALHRTTPTSADDSDGMPPGLATRLPGADFDAAAGEVLQALQDLADLHPIARGAFSRRAWDLADLSREGDRVEGAVWSARLMSADCAALPFVPLGGAARRLLNRGGSPAERLRDHCRAVLEGATAGHGFLHRLQKWSERARQMTVRIKGDNPARIIAVLLAHPQALTSTVEAAAGISRDTAERLLARMTELGLVREITGTRRFRIWSAAL